MTKELEIFSPEMKDFVDVEVKTYDRVLVCPVCRKGELKWDPNKNREFNHAEGCAYIAHKCTNENCDHEVKIADMVYPCMVYRRTVDVDYDELEPNSPTLKVVGGLDGGSQS